MPPKGKKRTLETDESSPKSKKSSSSKKTPLIDDDEIIEAATITAAPTAKQLDPVERQRKAVAYKSFLNRGGPDAPGSKDIPQGMEGCLQSLTFVITGVLPSLERDECEKIIKSYGGRVTTAVSGKTDYLLAGRDVGKTKTEKATKLRVKIISEDDLLQMIRTRPGNKDADTKVTTTSSSKPTALKPVENTSFVSISSPKLNVYRQDDGVLWVDKYKPTSLSQIVGQQTDKSPMKKLIYYLTNWNTWHSTPLTGKRKKTIKSATVTSTDPSKFKAVLLIGPPGVGKTITAQLVCKALNMPFIERNASDNRSKSTMDKFELNSAYLTDENQAINKHVLIMDEVDSVTGNEDRGGIQTLIELIRTTRIPIILIANDRQAVKMRTLISYCYEIKFDRPSFLNVKSFILDLCTREHIHITHMSLDNLINACNRDIRKIIHTLNLYYKQSSSSLITNVSNLEKALSTSPFDACMKMFSLSNINLIDKTNLYFHDSSLVPLLIQENYTRVVPSITAERQPVGTRQRMELISKVADSLALGDICSKLNFTNGNRTLIGYQAMFSGVIPTTYLRGALTVVQFPAWFSNTQQQKSTDRRLIELETHCSLKTMSIDRKEFNLDYLPTFNSLFNYYLQNSNHKTCINLMTNYYFNQDDLQMMLTLSNYRKMTSNRNDLDTKTKTLLTKSLEKKRHRTPFKQIDINKIKPGMSGAREDDDDYHMTISDDDNDDDDKENLTSDNNFIQSNRKRRKIK